MNKENSTTGIQINPTHSEHKEPSERQNSNDTTANSHAQMNEKIKDGFSSASTYASGCAQAITKAIRVNSQTIRAKLSRSNQTDRTQEQASTTKASAPVRACWITLFIAWACFLIPIMGLGFVGAALASAASFISIIVMFKGQVGIGVIQFVLAVLFSPLLYFVGAWIWFMTLK